jgi:hypothetical protein
MKKLLLTTFTAFALTCVPTESSMVIFDYIGETYVTPNNIERTLLVNSDDGKSYNVAVRPLEEAITSHDGKFSIPLEYLFINNTREDVYFKYNEFSNVLWHQDNDGAPKNMTAKIKNCGIVPAGTYSIMLELQATDIQTGEIASASSFNLQFIVPIVHELNTYSETPKIVVSANDVFKKSHRVTNEVSPMVYIRSNTDWVLTLDTSDFGDMIGDYYVRTTAGSPKVTSRLQERAKITKDREIILARGKAPAENDYVTVEFSVESPANDVLRAGDYINRIKYVLREGQE